MCACMCNGYIFGVIKWLHYPSHQCLSRHRTQWVHTSLHYRKVPYLVNFISHLVSSLFVNKLLKVFVHHLFTTFVLKVYDFLEHWISSLPICLMFVHGLSFVGTTRFFSFIFFIILLRFRVCNFVGMSNLFSSYMFVVCSRFKVC